MVPRPANLLKGSFGNDPNTSCFAAWVVVVLQISFHPKLPLLHRSIWKPSFWQRLIPISVIQISSQLRSLVLPNPFQNFTIRPMLLSCRETLEEFTFVPRNDGEFTFTSRFPGIYSHVHPSFIMGRRCYCLRPDDGSQNTYAVFLLLPSTGPNILILQSASSTCQRFEDIIQGLVPHKNVCGLGRNMRILVAPSCCPRFRKLSINVLDCTHPWGCFSVVGKIWEYAKPSCYLHAAMDLCSYNNDSPALSHCQLWTWILSYMRQINNGVHKYLLRFRTSGAPSTSQIHGGHGAMPASLSALSTTHDDDKGIICLNSTCRKAEWISTYYGDRFEADDEL
jgi:hypothetical protein